MSLRRMMSVLYDKTVKIDLRWRVIAFLAVLLADAALVRTQPWPVVIGCAAYLVLVLPALARKP